VPPCSIHGRFFPCVPATAFMSASDGRLPGTYAKPTSFRSFAANKWSHSMLITGESERKRRIFGLARIQSRDSTTNFPPNSTSVKDEHFRSDSATFCTSPHFAISTIFNIGHASMPDRDISIFTEENRNSSNISQPFSPSRLLILLWRSFSFCNFVARPMWAQFGAL
jgi:hypothetical protein